MYKILLTMYASNYQGRLFNFLQQASFSSFLAISITIHFIHINITNQLKTLALHFLSPYTHTFPSTPFYPHSPSNHVGKYLTDSTGPHVSRQAHVKHFRSSTWVHVTRNLNTQFNSHFPYHHSFRLD